MEGIFNIEWEERDEKSTQLSKARGVWGKMSIRRKGSYRGWPAEPASGEGWSRMPQRRLKFWLDQEWESCWRMWQMWGRYWGTVGKATACDASITYGCWFKTWLLHFLFSSLLMAWSRQQKTAKMSGPMPHIWKTWKKLLAHGFSWPTSSYCGQTRGESADERSFFLIFFHLSLCAILSNK